MVRAETNRSCAGRAYGTVTQIIAGAVLMMPLLAGAQLPPAQNSPTAPVTADTSTALQGIHAGSAAAAERSVAGRGMLGFIGGLPIGFLGTLLLQGDPAGPIGVGLGLGIIGVAWKLGDAAPPQTQSILERGEAYRRAYSESYEKRLSERRKKAALLGGLAGAVTGLGILFSLLSGLDT